MAPETASAPIEVRVPDIGDFDEVPVIEVLVKAGDRIAKDDSLITIESEKASMEVPSPASGVVKDVTVAVGDRVSKGKTILYLEAESANTADSETNAAPAATATAVTADKEPE
ncbi:MAG: biotin/lipoyl-binding protein, partial [Candidatus Eremiobacteraeota bacterium]|nr:biotin/lipoyl-binding protein [Candidatus Eremiobacteraeota bacterium]